MTVSFARRNRRRSPSATFIAWFVVALLPGALPADILSLEAPYRAFQNGKWGFVDARGGTAIPFRFSTVGPFSEGLAMACEKEYRCGYIDRNGTFVVPPQYLHALEFQGGTGWVFAGPSWNAKKAVFVDRSGRARSTSYFPDPNPALTNAPFFSQGLAAIQSGGKYGYINLEGAIAIPAQFDFAWPFRDGLACVNVDKTRRLSGFIDTSGRLVVPGRYRKCEPFGEGLAFVIEIFETPEGRDYKQGYIDRSGEYKLMLPKRDHGYTFQNGRARVLETNPDGYRFIDKKGATLIGPFPYSFPRDFANGYVQFHDGAQIGFMDESGRIVVPARPASNASDFSAEGIAWLLLGDGTSLYINTRGETIYKFKP